MINFENNCLDFKYKESINASGCSPHCHNHYELTYVLEGDVDYLIEGKKYSIAPGSILLITPQVFHSVKVNSGRPYRRYATHFDPQILPIERRKFLLTPFTSIMQNPLSKIYFENVEQYHIPIYYKDLQALNENPHLKKNVRDQMIAISFEALLSRVLYMYTAENTSTVNTHSDIISQIISYLNEHLTDNVTLDQIAKEFFISKHHLCRLFRNATGTTVIDYLTRKRISVAEHLLNNGHSAQNAALECGFDDYSAFYRAYVRVLGHSPSRDKNISI